MPIRIDGRNNWALFHDSDQDVNGDRDPYLCFDCVLDDSLKLFDSQKLLNPFEKQFDLPTAAIKLRDGQCRQIEVVV